MCTYSTPSERNAWAGLDRRHLEGSKWKEMSPGSSRLFVLAVDSFFGGGGGVTEEGTEGCLESLSKWLWEELREQSWCRNKPCLFSFLVSTVTENGESYDLDKTYQMEQYFKSVGFSSHMRLVKSPEKVFVKRRTIFFLKMERDHHCIQSRSSTLFAFS